MKTEQPCSMCKGESKTKCIICGWRKGSRAVAKPVCRIHHYDVVDQLECPTCGPCKECKGLTKNTCPTCGWKRPRKKDMAVHERLRFDGYEERIRYLRATKAKLIKFRMDSTSTGVLAEDGTVIEEPHTGIDEKIVAELGDWRTG